MYNETALNTDLALERVTRLYEEEYKPLLEIYNIGLLFETLLEYFTGSCSLVVEMRTLDSEKGRVEMIYMVDCHRNDFLGDDEELRSFFMKRVYKPYEHFFKLAHLIADCKLSRKVFIKDTVATDSIVSIKANQELINLDINSNKLSGNLEKAEDLRALLKCLSFELV